MYRDVIFIISQKLYFLMHLYLLNNDVNKYLINLFVIHHD